MKKYSLSQAGMFLLVCFIPVLSGCSASTKMIMQAENGRTNNVLNMLDQGIDVDALLVDRSALFYASQNGHADTVKLLLDRGANPNLKDSMGVSPLRLAAEGGHLEIVNLLLAHGAAPDVRTREYGNLALHAACMNGHIDVVSILLKQGDYINYQSKIGMTPLIVAARHGHNDLVRMLIEQGANVDVADTNGLTALHYACVYGKKEMVSALLSAGADPNLRTSQGLTPLHMAASQKSVYRQKDDYKNRKEILIIAGADPSILSNFKQTADDVYAKGLLVPSTGDGWERLRRAQQSADVTAGMAAHQYQYNLNNDKILELQDTLKK
ncbi:MAG: ankyrin repeat domain-containing protein [Candidatus Omnitrophota bacterium]